MSQFATISNDPPTWVDCGDEWWWLSDELPEPSVPAGLTDQYRLRLRERAAMWYRKALGLLDEPTTTRILERLKLLDPAD